MKKKKPQKRKLTDRQFAEAQAQAAITAYMLAKGSKFFTLTVSPAPILKGKHAGKVPLQFANFDAEMRAEVELPKGRCTLAGGILQELVLRDLVRERKKILTPQFRKPMQPAEVAAQLAEDAALDQIIEERDLPLSRESLRDIVRGKRQRDRLKPKDKREAARRKAKKR